MAKRLRVAETFDEIFDFVHRTRVNIPIINLLLPAPGTVIHERLKDAGRLLIESEDDFLRNALYYNISCSRCFYRPANMSTDELERRLLDLRKRLSAPREILWRSAAGDALDAFLFLMNLDFWREKRKMTRAWGAARGMTERSASRPSVSSDRGVRDERALPPG